jgi:hypothetical protein
MTMAISNQFITHFADACGPLGGGCGRIAQAIAKSRNEKFIPVVECYPGVDELMILKELESRLTTATHLAFRDRVKAARIRACHGTNWAIPDSRTDPSPGYGLGSGSHESGNCGID